MRVWHTLVGFPGLQKVDTKLVCRVKSLLVVAIERDILRFSRRPPGTVFKVVKNHSEQENKKIYYEIKKFKHWVDRFVGQIVKIKLFY